MFWFGYGNTQVYVSDMPDLIKIYENFSAIIKITTTKISQTLRHYHDITQVRSRNSLVATDTYMNILDHSVTLLQNNNISCSRLSARNLEMCNFLNVFLLCAIYYQSHFHFGQGNIIQLSAWLHDIFFQYVVKLWHDCKPMNKTILTPYGLISVKNLV